MIEQDAIDAVVRLLESIDGTLTDMLALAQHRTAQARAAAPKQLATDRDMDGKYGNPPVKFNPRDWTGLSCIGRTLSECPPEFLDLIAETFDYFAMKAEQNDERTSQNKPVADYKRADAARARGWAKRIRDGKHKQEPSLGDAEPWADSDSTDGETEDPWAK